MIKLGIAGVCGKMGRRIFELASADKGFEITFALEKKGTPMIGKELGKLKISSTASPGMTLCILALSMLKGFLCLSAMYNSTSYSLLLQKASTIAASLEP